MIERSCKNCKHYPVVLGTPTVNDWSKRCWDCVGVSEFSGTKLAMFEPKEVKVYSQEPQSALGKLFKEKLSG